MRNTYVACVDNLDDNTRYAYVLCVRKGTNIALYNWKLNGTPRRRTWAVICESKQEALDMVAEWNEGFRISGVLHSTPENSTRLLFC